MLFGVASAASAQTDPGPRGGPANAGGAAAGLDADYTVLFTAARARFQFAVIIGDMVRYQPSGRL
jgi:hypothetical protein